MWVERTVLTNNDQNSSKHENAERGGGILSPRNLLNASTISKQNE